MPNRMSAVALDYAKLSAWQGQAMLGLENAAYLDGLDDILGTGGGGMPAKEILVQEQAAAGDGYSKHDNCGVCGTFVEEEEAQSRIVRCQQAMLADADFLLDHMRPATRLVFKEMLRRRGIVLPRRD